MRTLELQCDDVERDELVERFLSKTLSQDARERFESHFVTCDRCQQALELGTAIRVSFRASATEEHPNLLKRLAPSRPQWLALAGAMAALLVLFVSTRDRPASLTAYQQLGAVRQAPVYLGVPVRAEVETISEGHFDGAMRHYMANRYADAIQGLRESIAAGAANPPVEFFLGASLLLSNQSEEAVNAFTRVIALGDSPYVVEAHYYRAKAWLQLAEPQRALADLNEAGRYDGEIGRQARALRDSVPGVVVR